MEPATESTTATDATAPVETAIPTPAPAAEVAPEATPAPTEAATPVAAETAPVPATDPTDEPLGEPGLKALERERTARKELDASLKALTAQFEEYKAKAESSVESAIAAERDVLKARLEALESSAHQRSASEALAKAAEAAGAPNPALVTRLVDAAKFDATADNSAALIEAVKSEFPDLFAPVPQPGLSTQDGPAGQDGTPYFSREQVKAMSIEEYGANRAHVLTSMKTW